MNDSRKNYPLLKIYHCTKNEEILNGKLHFLCSVQNNPDLTNTWVEKIYRKIKLESIETHSLVQAWETYHCLPGTLNTY